MIKQISRITSAITTPLFSSGKRFGKRKKISDHLDWRPEAIARQNRNKNLSKISRWS